MTVLKMSGACKACGAYSFVLTSTEDGLVEGSARHYDGHADHVVVVGGMPLVGAVAEHFDRTTPPPAAVPASDDTTPLSE